MARRRGRTKQPATLERVSAMQTISPFEALAYLKPGEHVSLRFKHGHLFRKFDSPDAVRILRHKLAEGVVSRGGKLLYLQLMVSVHAFHRAMAQCKLPPMGPHHVSTHYQRKGDQEWVVRFDKAKTGRMGAVRTVFAGGRGQN